MALPIHKTEAKNFLRISGSDDDTQVEALIRAATQYAEYFTRRRLVAQTQIEYFDAFDYELELGWSPLVAVSSVQYIDADGNTQTESSDTYDSDVNRYPPVVYEAYNQTWPTTRDEPNAVIVTYTAGHEATFTAANATNELTCSGITFADTDRVRIRNSGGALPAGLSADTDYYVRSCTDGVFELAASSGGEAVAITDDGTGTHYIGYAQRGLSPEPIRQAILQLVAHWYENREAATGDVMVKEVPLAAQRLLWQNRIVELR